MTTRSTIAETRHSHTRLASMHVAQFYDVDAFPNRPIADFLGDGLRADESAIIIATPEHASALQAPLASDHAELRLNGGGSRLLVFDAQTLLDQFMDGALLNAERTRAVLGGALDQAALASPSGRARAFGELVALLAAQGNFAAAIELERIWNGLLQARPFRLYCAYPMQHFVHDSSNEIFSHVCDEHDEIVPVLSRLDRPEQHGRVLAILQRQAQALQLEIAERKKAVAELHESQRQLRALAAHLQSTREEERAHLARELHDELGQTLTALKMDLARWTRRMAPVENAPSAAATHGEVQEMTKLADDAIQSMRRILKELRPVELDTLGLVSALEGHLQEFQKRSGIETEFTADEALEEMDSSSALALFRIVQESLTNVMRHSRASRVIVTLKRDATRLVLEISDNGIGLSASDPLADGHWGILGMRERALVLDGSLEICSESSRGTTVRFSVPLESLASLRHTSLTALIHP